MRWPCDDCGPDEVRLDGLCTPLTADWYWMYDDGTHGDEAAGDGVFTQDGIKTRTGSTVYDDVTLPYEFGFRVLVTDEDGNHTIADTTLTVVAP